MSADLAGATLRPDGQGPGYIPRQAVMPVADSLVQFLKENFVGKTVRVRVDRSTCEGTLDRVLEHGPGGPLSLTIGSDTIVPYARITYIEIIDSDK